MIRKEEAIKNNYHLAWHVSAFVGGLFSGKLPDLQAILDKPIYRRKETGPINEEVENSKIKAMLDAMSSKLVDKNGNSLIKITHN